MGSIGFFSLGFSFTLMSVFSRVFRGDGFWGLTFLRDEFLRKESFFYYPVLVLVDRRSVRWINSEK